ncbi:MAG: glycosyltransferase, partial [Thermoanaerobaculia bacterium]
MSAAPRVSIVMPVYNGANYLGDAIDSALGQTWPNFEVIVVNDGSTDGGATEAIARSYGDRIRYYAKPNGHVASALNFGIRHMTGEYFSWLSHDDLYCPHKVAAEMDLLLAAGPRTIVYSDFETLDVETGIRTPVRLNAADPSRFRYALALNNSLHGCTLLIPKASLEEAGPFREDLRTTQDYDMWFRLAARNRFVHLPSILVTSRQHAEQGTRALRDVASAECDRLLETFVHNLRPEEITVATSSSPARAYAALASSFGRRAFLRAQATASLRAKEALENAAPVERFRDAALIGLEKYAGPIARRARRVLSALERRSAGRFASARRKFSHIYRHNVFGGAESRSGVGSNLEQTEIVRRDLPGILREFGVRSMIDAPCGDFFWMQHVDLGIDRYVGVDIVEELIARDREQYAREGREFLRLDIIEDPLPGADLIFCRDCLVHLDFAQAHRALENFKRSGAQYLLTTTFTGRDLNVDLVGADIWRTLNLELA